MDDEQRQMVCQWAEKLSGLLTCEGLTEIIGRFLLAHTGLQLHPTLPGSPEIGTKISFVNSAGQVSNDGVIIGLMTVPKEPDYQRSRAHTFALILCRDGNVIRLEQEKFSSLLPAPNAQQE